MLRVFRAALDPVAHQRNLALGELLAALARRHRIVLVLRRDAFEQLALLRLAGDDRLVAAEIRERALREIQPVAVLAPLPLLFIGAVAEEAVIREDGPDLALKIRRRLRAAQRGKEERRHDDGDERER